MPKLPEFPPKIPFTLGRGSGIFTPGIHRSTPIEELELNRKLTPYVEDEQTAFKDYSRLADDSYNIGRPDIAATLQSMAEDEHRHMLNIQTMLKDLRWH